MLGKWNPTSPGGGWAMGDPEIARQYPNQFVVAVPNQIVAAGDDEERVRAEAALKLNLPAGDVAVVHIAPPEARPVHDWF